MQLIMGAIIILALFSVLRLLMGPTLWDRLLALNLVSSKFIMILVLLSLVRGNDFYLDIAIVYVVLGFIGIVFMSIFIQKKGRF